MGAFGSPRDWPEELHGMEIEFQFESPLHDAIDREKGQKWLETLSMLSGAVEFAPEARHMVDARVALRDALDGVGISPAWTRSDADIDELVAADAEQAAQAQALQAAEQGSVAAKNLADAGATIGGEEGGALTY